jgi:DHA1 family bicyclomycin/chloramphenicol resistance-like MFS transporter
VVRDVYSGARAGRELSLMSMVMAVAPVIAPMIGGAVQMLFGWRASFAVLTASGILIAALIWLYLPETLERRATEPVSVRSMLRSFATFLSDGGYLAHCGMAILVFAGLFAWISASSFVLQDLYHLSAFAFGVSFAIASAGFMAGSLIASHFVSHWGIGRTLGFGALAQAAGGLLMMAALAIGFRSAAALVGPMAIYLVGLGLTLPQAMAGAMHPYRDRAGAASSLIGFLQQSGAALCGVAVAHFLGETAWPMAVAVALAGVASVLLWVLTRDVRERALR